MQSISILFLILAHLMGGLNDHASHRESEWESESALRLEAGSEVITVFLVRHAEKCSEPAGDPDLTPYGWKRARDLVRVLKHVQLDAIYSTPFARTLNTARPVAEDHDVKIIETPAAQGFMAAMVERIKNGEARSVLVSGHSNTTPRVVNLLAGTQYDDLDESVYDRLYIVTLYKDGTAGVHILTYGAPSGKVEDCA